MRLYIGLVTVVVLQYLSRFCTNFFYATVSGVIEQSSFCYNYILSHSKDVEISETYIVFEQLSNCAMLSTVTVNAYTALTTSSPSTALLIIACLASRRGACGAVLLTVEFVGEHTSEV